MNDRTHNWTLSKDNNVLVREHMGLVSRCFSRAISRIATHLGAGLLMPRAYHCIVNMPTPKYELLDIICTALNKDSLIFYY